jgi:phosphocarrier protein HPr
MSKELLDTMMSNESVARIVGSAALTHAGGLHARPSIKVTQLAKRFEARVWVGSTEEGPWIDAKSIARVMAMKLPSPSTVHFAAEGHDAAAVLDALIKLVESDFLDA